MNRREFLGQVALTAGSLSTCSSLNAQTTPDSPVARARTPKKIIVIGAGLAGLGAGYELTQAGDDVGVLQGRPRPRRRGPTIPRPVFGGPPPRGPAPFISDNPPPTPQYTQPFRLS